MTPKLQSEGLDELLVHAGWARALARRLVRDAHAADDLVQRTWVAALEHPPRGGAPRAWIESVLRNFALQDLRSRLRRKRREEHGARPERLEDGAGESLAAQEQLFVALKALDEPYRTLIWARYYEGLSASEIAARTETPLQTVKNRLTRAHELLRERLDRQHGGERARWCLAFLPWTADRGYIAALLGAVLVHLKLKIGLVAAATAGAALLLAGLFQRADQMPAPTLAGALERPSLAAPEKERALTPTLAPDARVEAATAEVETPSAKPAAPAVVLASMRGRVLDLDDHPVGGIEIEAVERKDAAGAPLVARSAGDGTFEFASFAGGSRLLVRDPAWVTIFTGVGFAGGTPITLIASPRRALAGIVQDDRGEPLNGAELMLVLDEARRTRIQARDEASFEMLWRTKTDEHGRFELPDAPLGVDQLRISSGGCVTKSFTAPAVASFDLVYALERMPAESLLVHGRVVGTDGAGIEGAYIALGREGARSAADGSFTLDLQSEDGRLEMVRKRAEQAPLVLMALATGLQPAEIALGTFDELKQRARNERFELVLGTPTLEIRGHVLDEDGKPIPDASVQIRDQTPFARLPFNLGGVDVMFDRSVESIARNESMIDFPVKTAANGAFTLRGLCARAYQLDVIDGANWRMTAFGPVRAGEHEVEIRLKRITERTRVAGRVLSALDEPVAGIGVRLALAVPGTNMPVEGSTTETDGAGRFEFADVPRVAMELNAQGPDVLGHESMKLDPTGDLSDLVLAVQLDASLIVDITRTPERADAVRVLDKHDQVLSLTAMRGMLDTNENTALVSWDSEQMPLQGGLSGKLRTPEHARTLVLLKQGKEVDRVPLRLTRGKLTTIEL
jgi:RNA polymerase sigma factor (sigma-70 family)